DLEITRLDDGQQLAFTAEVDVRPKFELPDLSAISVTVDNAEVGPDEVEEYLSDLRERFASLRGVDRPAPDAAYVSLHLSLRVGRRQAGRGRAGQRRVVPGGQRDSAGRPGRDPGRHVRGRRDHLHRGTGRR